MAIRNPFTVEEKELLAKFLAKRPSTNRTAPSVYAQFERENPKTKHSAAAWMEHYKKAGHEDINRRIAIIRKQKERKIEVAAQLAAEAEAEAEGAEAGGSKSKGKKRAREPSTSEESSSESDSSSAPKRHQTRVPFDEDDFKTLVRYEIKASEKDWTRAELYKRLAKNHDDHTANSWQSYHRDNRERVDKAVRKARRNSKTGEEEEAEKRAAELAKKVKQEKAAAVEARRHSESRKAVPKSSSPERQSPPAARPSPKKMTVAELVVPATIRPAKKPESASSNVASTSKVQLAPKAAKGVQGAAARASSSVEPAGEARAFTETDINLLVHTIARVDVEEGSKAQAYDFLAAKHPQHSRDEWRAYFQTHRAEIDPLVTAKVLEVLQARERKRAREEQITEEEVPVARIDKGKGKEVVREEVEVVQEIEQVGEERAEETLEELETGTVVDQRPVGEEVAVTRVIEIETTVEREMDPVEEEDQLDSEDEQMEVERQLTPGLAATQAHVESHSQSQDPSPPTPQPTPPSQHSQSQHSQSHPPAPAHESNSTGEEPSTQNDDVVPALEPQPEVAEEKPLFDRGWSLPSACAKYDLYPPPVNNDSELDEDDRRMEALLTGEGQKDAELGGDWGWQPLTPDQELLVQGVFETEVLLVQEEQRRAAEAEAAKAAAEEQRRLAQIAAERAAAEKAAAAAKAAVEQEKTAAAEKAARENAAREKALKEKAAKEKAAKEKAAREKAAREKEQAARRRAEEEEAQRRRIEEDHRRRVEEAAEAERRRVEAVAQADRLRSEKEAQDRAISAIRKQAEQQAREAEAAKIEREVDIKRKAAIKTGKQRDSRPVHSTPLSGKIAPPMPAPDPAPATVTPRSKPAPIPVTSEAKPVIPRAKRPRDSTFTEPTKKARLLSDPSKPEILHTPDAQNLKAILRSRRDRYRLPKKGEFALYAACGCPKDLTIYDQACQWFSPTQRPAEGTPEYEELKRIVSIRVWTYDDDIVVLTGTPQAKERIDKQKGRNAVATRRAFLEDLGKVQISDLERGWPWF